MWVKVSDSFPRHPKLMAAARELGRSNHIALAAGFWLFGQCYAAEQLTDGFLPLDAVEAFPVKQPLAFAQAMVKAGLWETTDGGYQIHDYREWNPAAETVRERRARDRKRKADSKQIPRGTDADSARSPVHTRTRDPVPVPVPEKEPPCC